MHKFLVGLVLWTVQDSPGDFANIGKNVMLKQFVPQGCLTISYIETENIFQNGWKRSFLNYLCCLDTIALYIILNDMIILMLSLGK